MAEYAGINVRSDGRDDFDFFIGSWDSHQRKLKQWLQGCDEWYEFTGVSVVRTILGGLGNFDEVTLEMPTGRVIGVTLRLFDPRTRLWSIYWSSSTQGTLDTPMVGRFEQGRGEFYNRETFEGRSIFSRFLWTSNSGNACRWEQAFSADGGHTWETNWTADFTRRNDATTPRTM